MKTTRRNAYITKRVLPTDFVEDDIDLNYLDDENLQELEEMYTSGKYTLTELKDYFGLSTYFLKKNIARFQRKVVD